MQPGDIVGDRFTIEGLAGSGGMAEVFRAVDGTTGGTVALKVLQGTLEDGEDRFAREARVLARLKHPGIVGYVAHGVTEGGAPFLAMRWVDGETLSARLKARGPLGGEATVDIGVAVATALAEAHAKDVVHRDLKPSNLMIPNGAAPSAVMLLDFGIARAMDATVALTQPGMLVGTPGYVSPEQARASPDVDARSDLFSLGCVLFACLTGHAPFRGSDMVAVLAKILFQETPHVREERKDVHPALDALIARMMAKEREDRFPSATAAADALRALRPSVGTDQPSYGSSHASTPRVSAREARLCSVVFVGQRAGGVPEDAVDLGRRFGGVPEALANGTMAVKFVESAGATMRALTAARCALALRSRMPGVLVTVATVRSDTTSDEMVTAAIDRAAELLRDGPRSARGGAPFVRIDPVTAGLLDSRFTVHDGALGLELIGEDESSAHDWRSMRRAQAPCVGRDRELAVLDATFEQVRNDHVARAMLVVADAGTGKTRLAKEWQQRLRATPAAEAAVWTTRADPMGSQAPFSMLGQAIRRVAGAHDDDPLPERQQKLRARLSLVLPPADLERVLCFVAEVAGAPFDDAHNDELAAARRERVLMADQIRRAWEDWIMAECARAPLLLLLEDLHWSDAASLRLVDAALARAADAPLMVLGLGRPSVKTSWPDLFAGRRVQEMKLEDLPRKSAERLVNALTGGVLDASTMERVLALANGNPFFLEELVRTVGEGRGGALPETVLAVVESRLDRFPPDARRVLRAASVFGQTFWVGGLSALLGDMDAGAVEHWLAALDLLDVLSAVTPARFTDERELTFRHALMRDAAYAMLPEDERRAAHGVAASWLEAMGELDPGVLAAHFERAGETKRAADCYRRAARQMLEGNDFEGAIALAERGVACHPPDATLLPLWITIAEAKRWAGDNGGVERAASEALRLSPRGSDEWAVALTAAASASFKLGHVRQADQRMLEAMAALAEEPVTHAKVVMAATVGINILFAGRLQDATELRARLAAAPVDTRDGQARGILHSFEAFFADGSGDPRGQVEHFDLAASAYQTVGNLRAAALARANAAYARLVVGDYEGAEAQLRAWLPVAERMHLNLVAATIRVDLTAALERLGRWDEAVTMGELAAGEFMAQGDRRMEGAARAQLAMALLRRGDVDRALSEARLASELTHAAKREHGQIRATLAYVLLKANQPMEALEQSTEAMAALEAAGEGASGSTLVRLVHTRALQAAGRFEAARAALADAYARLIAQADGLSDPAWRERFLQRPWEHAQTIAWAAASGLSA